MAKASFLSKKSGFMMMETETSNGFGSDKGSTQRNAVVDGVVGGASFCSLGLQPYNTSATAFKSPVGMAAAAAAACLKTQYPFTSAQYQELERQALVFKYMMASIPVPPDLLISTTRTLSHSSASAAYPSLGRGSCFNLRFSNGSDPEPGRCRRTDGKKWRCSRDVAPDQKYCERHMHRSRPRSRKHVEVQTEINNNNSSSSIIPPTTTSRSSSRPYPQPALFLPKPLPLDTNMASNTSYKDSRGMDWMLKSENAPMWKGNSTSTANNHPFFQQQYHDNNNLNSYTDFGSSLEGLEAHDQSENCFLFLNPELESISDQRQMPRRFIDAWSNTRDSPTGNNSKSNSSEKLSPSTLSLSMSSDNNGIGEDIEDCGDATGVSKSQQPLSWMTPVSWIGSSPGGPLGEVLQSSSKSGCLNSSICNTGNRSGLNLMTDDWGGSRDTSPRTTAASSPSGVLQHKTLASPSDSSGGNSPTTFKAAAARTEIALQWMSQNK